MNREITNSTGMLLGTFNELDVGVQSWESIPGPLDFRAKLNESGGALILKKGQILYRVPKDDKERWVLQLYYVLEVNPHVKHSSHHYLDDEQAAKWFKMSGYWHELPPPLIYALTGHISEEKEAHLNVRVPIAMKDTITRGAEKHNQNVSEWVRDAIYNYLDDELK